MGKVGPRGIYNAMCQVCGFEYKNHELRHRWDGKIVCKDDWEPRHILDFYQTKDDSSKLPWISPEIDGPDIVLAGPFVCAGPRTQGRADIGIADCARADKDNY